jgi:hypothetical protein
MINILLLTDSLVAVDEPVAESGSGFLLLELMKDVAFR